MYETINIKDIIRMNQDVGATGDFSNKSSFEYALSIVKERKSWLHELSFLVRSLLVDHAFRDGNKRTALAIILVYLSDRNIEYDKERLIQVIHSISKKNISDIKKIARLIQSATIH
ncbi:Fic family protein [Candidatus Woesearchaeota archaeon]|nr:Fic family protein [Candidatus Woesearchaeota archaeon]